MLRSYGRKVKAVARGKAGLGRRGETLAAEALGAQGFVLLTRNWHCRYGEVDLVVQRGADLYFVEVRTRRSAASPSPEESLSPHKHARMEMVARTYLGDHPSEPAVTWHLSFVAVAMDRTGRVQRITFYPDLQGAPEELT
jgi:putative endonuclease